VFCLAWAYAAGRIVLWRLPGPWELALAVGTALESLLIFGLLCLDLGYLRVYLVLGGVAIGVACLAAWRTRGKVFSDPVTAPAARGVRLLFGVIVTAFSALYIVNAFAPEIQADGVTYHLGLAAEYVRKRGFPDRVGFFEMVPQGLEMLFTVAYAIGRHSAAKLVHLGYLLATVPLIVRIGRRLRLPDTSAMAAAGIYFCAPVTGIAGSCAYNDAALVFFVLMTFYLLLVWRDLGNPRYLLAAGITAGFCFAIKFTGIIVLPLAALAVVVMKRQLRPVWWMATGVIMIALWMIRDWVMSGNPLAPLFNRYFPNGYFHAATEEFLAQNLRDYGVPRARIPWELAIGGGLQGFYGPLLFVIPLGLWALRKPVGRWCWLAAALLAAPWFWNVGARFLMPSFVFMTLALVIAWPRAALACLLLQAVTSWPEVVTLYNPRDTWRLHGFPLQAALRIQPEEQYLQHEVDAYAMARVIQNNVPLNERVYALESIAIAYTSRETLEYWHSAQGETMLDWLRVAWQWPDAPLYNVSSTWEPQLLKALRFRLTTAHPGEWCLHEVRLQAGEDRIRNSPRWTLSGWPDEWELPVAFDDNLASRWRTWTPMRPGMYAQVDLDRPQLVSGATLITHTPVYNVPMEFYGMDSAGRWHSFGVGKVEQRPKEDMRRPTMRAIKKQGFGYIAAPTGPDGLGPLGETLRDHEVEWGIIRVGEAHGSWLFRIH
jgi:hypothetical protein